MKSLQTYEELIKLNKKDQTQFLKEAFDKWSVPKVAEDLGTYPNKLRRLAIKLEVEIKNQSEAQKLALKTGRKDHPTAGTKRSAETKIKISNKAAESWENLPDEEKKRRSDLAKDQWNNKSDEDKEEFYRAANAAVRATAKDGSKLEKIILEHLLGMGLTVDFHKEHNLVNSKLQLDLYIQNLGVAVEVDGPNHFLPIWGEDSLVKTIDADTRKNGLVLGLGQCMIRIRYAKTPSQKKIRDILAELTQTINEIKTSYPKDGERLFYLGDK